MTGLAGNAQLINPRSAYSATQGQVVYSRSTSMELAGMTAPATTMKSMASVHSATQAALNVTKSARNASNATLECTSWGTSAMTSVQQHTMELMILRPVSFATHPV